ncbi:nuclease A inhibitor family protein [Hymenobacter sp. BT728]|nr:nuclease A inhibitor family protein [Hymenobacter pini]MCA8830745.1 nuclease A inhibitor family protein [Hymenobacter pini]
MNQLAAAIGSQVPAQVTGTPAAPADPRDTKGGRETIEEAEPQAKHDKAAKPATSDDPTLAQLRDTTKGLVYMSEGEAPLEPVSFAAPEGGLTDAAVAKLAGLPADTKVEKQELTYFLRNHTADNGVLGNPEQANRYKALQMYLKQELSGTQVYRLGTGPQITALVLGEAEGGKLQGFKTVLTET